MHYFLSKRTEPFWQDNKAVSTVPETLLASLDSWKHQLMTGYDFDNVYEPFPLDSYQYVLYGMGFEQALTFNESSYSLQDFAKQQYDTVQELTQKMQQQLPENRALLSKIAQYGFQKI